MTEQSIIMTCGFPGSGKSTYISNNYPGSIILSNDSLPKGKKLIKEFENILQLNEYKTLVLDNNHLTRENRKEFIDVANKYNKKIEMLYFNSSIENSQIHVLKRQWNKFNTLFLTGINKEISDPHIFPPAVLFKARKVFEEPLVTEGFSRVSNVLTSDAKHLFNEYPNKAIFFDVDGTLRKTEHLPNKYPTKVEEIEPYKPIEIMKKVLERYRKDGYLFVGVSNQSGIAKGVLTEKDCEDCMNKTKEILGLDDIEIKWCSHKAVPISCYCRKPQSGLGIYFIEKYKINPANSIMIGDRTTDKTFAERLGMKYISADKFWN